MGFDKAWLKKLEYESQVNGKMYKWEAWKKKKLLEQYEEKERDTEEEFWKCVEDFMFRDYDREN